jgi:hypothetical protein
MLSYLGNFSNNHLVGWIGSNKVLSVKEERNATKSPSFQAKFPTCLPSPSFRGAPGTPGPPALWNEGIVIS